MLAVAGALGTGRPERRNHDMWRHRIRMLLFRNRGSDVKHDPSGEVGEDLVEREVTALQRRHAGQGIEWRVDLPARNAGRRGNRFDALRSEFGLRTRHIEAVRHENDTANVFGAEDLCRSHGVLMRVTRSYLRPAHPHAELALESRLH